jgi:predicted exporter
MKNHFSAPNKPPLVIWFLLHGLLALLLAASCLFFRKLTLNTDLLDILPVSNSLKQISKADKALSAKTARSFFILAEADDFDGAKAAAQALYERVLGVFGAEKLFDEIELYIDDEIMLQLTDYLYRYRYMLQDGETTALLEDGNAELVASEGLASAFGMFNAAPLDNMETDPFFLTERLASRFFSLLLRQGSSMAPRENVLYAEAGGKFYCLIRGTFSDAGLSLAGKQNAVPLIYDMAGQIKLQTPDVNFIYSGIPFHTYESSKTAQTEISLITTVSLIVIVLIFLLAFRAFLPILLSFCAVLVSIAAGTSAVLLFFSEIHIITFVFGTTLIGVCVDYAIHYFVSGGRIGKIMRSITLCFLSTEIAFIALFCAPFMLLKQFAVFLFFGLASAFLSVLCVFPALSAVTVKIAIKKHKSLGAFPCVSILICFALALITVLFANRHNIKIENDLSSLYTMSERLKESEKTAAAVLNSGASGFYFIVEGDSPDEVLRREETLCRNLDKVLSNSDGQSYLSVSSFVPSIETQRESYAASKKLLPLAGQQLSYLGFYGESLELFLDDFASSEGEFIIFDKLPPYIKNIVSHLWIGEIDGSYFTCVLPLHVNAASVLTDAAAQLPAVHFVNKTKSINAELDALTKNILCLFAAAFILVCIVLFMFYRLKNTLKVCLSIMFSFSCVFAALSIFNIPFGFFSAAALVLIFGMGVDYMVFMIDGLSDGESFFAVKLSWLTTELSFGALALSSFAPVHIFGLTVFSGLGAAFVSAALLNSPRPYEAGAQP